MKLNLKQKLLLLLFLPLSFIVFMFVLLINNTLTNKQNLEETKTYLTEVQCLSKIIHTLQIERGLSVYYILYKTHQIKESLLQARDNVDASVQKCKAKNLEVSYSLINLVQNDFEQITKYRLNIENNELNKNEIVEIYSQLISKLQRRIKVIPTLTKDSENSMYINSYNFLLNSKESLGKIRAILLEGFLDTHNVEDIKNIYYLKNDYLKNMKDFEIIISKEFLKEYKIKVKNKHIDLTMEILNEVIYDKNYKINADIWFDTTTKSINALYEIEKLIFKKINDLIESKIDQILLKIYSLNAFLIFSIICIIVLMVVISKEILKSTSLLEQSYEESLQLLEQYKATVDMSFIVSKTDSKGIITYANSEFCRVSGFNKEELLGKPHNIVRHIDMPKEIFEQMWYTIKELKKPWIGKIKNQKKEGSEYWVHAIINPILDIQGNIIEYIAIRTDITELETTKEYLQKQFDINKENFKDVLTLSKLYENAIEQSNLILRIAPNRKITYANKLFYEKSGYAQDELIGKDYFLIKRPKEVTHEDIQKIWKEITKGEIWKGQIANIDKNGKTFHSLATVVPIKNSKGKVLEYMSIRKDVTEVFSLHLQLEKMQQEIIYKMGEIAETRSKETGNHVKRVAYYSKLLAELYGLSLKEIEILFAASPMHDIGKVGISDSILNKRSKLTKEEFDVIKKHTILGHNILKESTGEVFQAAAIIAKEHHEKFDGTGYPFGLKGEEIHIYGRITAVADVFDALGHDRVYKQAWDIEKILDLFQKEKGKHFDPYLIELFFTHLDKFLEIKESLEDKYIH